MWGIPVGFQIDPLIHSIVQGFYTNAAVNSLFTGSGRYFSAQRRIGRRMTAETATIDPTKLAKILALTGSNHEGEAFAAFRTARRLMARAGVSLVDLAFKDVSSAPASVCEAPAPEREKSAYEDRRKILALQRALDDLDKRFADQVRQAARHESRAREFSHQVSVLESALQKKIAETEGWRERAWRVMWQQSQEIERLKARLESSPSD